MAEERTLEAGAESLGDLASLGTELQNPRTAHIDEMSTREALEAINDLDQEVAPAVRVAIPAIAAVVDGAYERMQRGGRLIYVGAGTSGRLGVLDASECPPTYGVSPDLVVGVMAGGPEALFRAKEGVEDDPVQGAAAMDAYDVCERDTVVGLAASGRTPFVIGALDRARELGALTCSVSCVRDARLSRHVELPIECPVGPEPITGSTRMRSGTAQKLVCNMISTELMVKRGKVYGNLMVDLQPTNQKLVARARRIIDHVSGVGEERAAQVLEASDNDVKTAICAAVSGRPVEACRAMLESQGGNVARAIRSLRMA